jgi:hypothetical protein
VQQFNQDDDPNFGQHIDAAQSNIEEGLMEAGFAQGSDGHWRNQFNESVGIQRQGEQALLVSQYDPSGNVMHSERISSLAQAANSNIVQRILLEREFLNQMQPEEPVLMKAIKALTTLFGVQKAYNRNQPRVPRGSGETSGRWMSTGGDVFSTRNASANALVPHEVRAQARADAVNNRFPMGSLRNGNPDLAERIAVGEHLRDEYVQQGRSTDQVYEHGTQGMQPGQYTEQREALHAEILAAWMATIAGKPKNHEAVVMAGLPGAGKGFAQHSVPSQDLGYNPDDFVTIDPDWFKEQLVERDPSDFAGLPGAEAAGLYHEESSHLAKRALAMMTEPDSKFYGTNVLFDYTMSSEHSGAGKIQQLQDAGYHTRVVLVDTNPEDALANAESRYMQGVKENGSGRLIHFASSTKQAANGTSDSREAFNKLKHKADAFTHISGVNTTKGGSARPHVIERSAA